VQLKTSCNATTLTVDRDGRLEAPRFVDPIHNCIAEYLTVSVEKNSQEFVSAQFPKHLRDRLARLAVVHERSLSGEVRLAVHQYLRLHEDPPCTSSSSFSGSRRQLVASGGIRRGCVTFEALTAKIERAHRDVQRQIPGAQERLAELQREFRMGQYEIVRTPRGATAKLIETPPRRRTAKRVLQPKPKRKQRPSWWLGEDEPEPWRLRY
jgi:hypothetical protein